MMRKVIITAIVAGAAYAASLAIPLSAGSSLRVIDGDTIEMNGETVRIANIDAPETARAKCEAERIRGYAVTQALTDLLARGAVTLQRGDPKSRRQVDRYGRTLGLVFVDGHDVGELLITMGHARCWTGKRRPWC
ncbi:thermonuclease family protein [Shinella sp. DD12]|uniref:thermonuclease family protein n=1 Tax=Shinella sp. DD12 TaxID=1410620 RepID=UPI0003C54B09|nr:thermonuclease family protein [Shinella sp. DD12]EYR84261.1 nuclease [Shinella sp. DD12]